MQGENAINKKIKICLAITKGVWGGAQEYVFSLATQLPKDQFDVFVICGQGEALPQKLTEKNIRTILIPNMGRDISFRNEIKNFFQLVKILKKERPDVLHLNSSKIGFLGGLAGRIACIPKIIFTAHGWAFNENRFWLSKKIFKFIQWLTIIFCHQTIAVSEKTKNDIISFPFVKNKITTIHNGIGHIDFLPKEVARQKLAEMSKTVFDIEKLWIGTVSELHKNKGLNFLVEASKNLPADAYIFIIGEGEERENLQKQIAKLGLKTRVFLLGRIENAKQYLKAFDIFTLTSRTEALPYSILEAGLAECAVVASRVGGIPEIIENNQSGILVEAGSVDQISKTIKDLIPNLENRKLFGHNLKEKILKDFSVEQMLSKTIEIYLK